MNQPGSDGIILDSGANEILRQVQVRVTPKELFISDDYHILTWFFRVEVRPLLISRLFLLKLGCVGQKTNRVYKLSCASLQLQSLRPCDFAAQVLPCVAVHASEGCIT